jgi:para-aminobenzoate synthetase component 1
MVHARLAGLPHPVLLEGSADHADLGRWSYCSADPVATLTLDATAWPTQSARLRATLRRDAEPAPGPPFRGGWIGWFGYELGRAFDHQPVAPRDQFSATDGALQLHDWVIAWDHLESRCWLCSTGIDAEGRADADRARRRADAVRRMLDDTPDRPAVVAATSGRVTGRSFTPAGYVSAVQRVIDHVRSGDIFQANLSRRLVVESPDEPGVLYRRLRALAPASHGALLDLAGGVVVSASPECFLRFDARTRRAESRPVKGTRPRDPDPARDAALAADLAASAKDRAENVMIVDLVRNDLHRVADPTSVEVPVLCRLDSHATVHHLVSVVRATLAPGRDALDLLAATFPAGSITGAPKLRAMAILAELEPVARGPYCGAIGWLGLDGSLGLSVAIRTMTYRDGAVAVHAGGGVTLLSEPPAEYQETRDKARALLEALEVAE